jgi:UDP-N-acetylglucosamine 3-dehydrogenase
MGSDHASILADLPIADVVAWCDTDPAVAGRSEGVPVMTDVGELLDSVDLDAVFVCTPPESHREVVEAAINAGLWVLCEKPVAADLADADRLVEIGEETGRLFIGHVIRFDPDYRAVEAAVSNGRIGRVVSMALRRSVPDFEGRVLASRTSLPVEVAVHDLDVVRWIGGEVSRVFGFAARTGISADRSIDAVAAVLELASGAVAVVETTWVTASASGHASDYRLAVFGTEGSAYAELRHPPVGIFAKGIPEFPRTGWISEVAGHLTGVVRAEDEHFLRTVLGDPSPWPSTVADARAALALALAVDASAVAGAPFAPE